MKNIFALLLGIFLSAPSFSMDCTASSNLCPAGQGCCATADEWFQKGTTDKGTCRVESQCGANKQYLFNGNPTVSTSCKNSYNNCPSGKGCCSSYDEWNQSGTTDQGTCRAEADCDKKWIWNGGLNPASGYKLPNPIPPLPTSNDEVAAGESAFSIVERWYNLDATSFIGNNGNTNVVPYLAVVNKDKSGYELSGLNYMQKSLARQAWADCLLGGPITKEVRYVQQYVNIKSPITKCYGDSNCRTKEGLMLKYYKNSALACLSTHFYSLYTVNGALPVVIPLQKKVDYSKCGNNIAIYPDCD